MDTDNSQKIIFVFLNIYNSNGISETKKVTFTTLVQLISPYDHMINIIIFGGGGGGGAGINKKFHSTF